MRGIILGRSIISGARAIGNNPSIWDNEWVQLLVIIVLIFIIIGILKFIIELLVIANKITKEYIGKKIKEIKQIIRFIKDREISDKQIDKLTKLLCLKNAGALTEEEFEEQKAKIMRKSK